MACGCQGSNYKVLNADGSQRAVYSTYEAAQKEIAANGGTMRATNELPTA